MYILSKNGKKFINFNNVASISIRKEYMQYHDTWWEIVAMYPAVSTDILYDVVGEFRTEENCKDAFNKLCCRIVSGGKNEIIDMNDL